MKALNFTIFQRIWVTSLLFTQAMERIHLRNYIGAKKKFGMMTKTGFSSVMLMVCSLFMILMATNLASGLRINEVELNPSGTDAGHEWVELYSEDSVDLQGIRSLAKRLCGQKWKLPYS